MTYEEIISKLQKILKEVLMNSKLEISDTDDLFECTELNTTHFSYFVQQVEEEFNIPELNIDYKNIKVRTLGILASIVNEVLLAKEDL